MKLTAEEWGDKKNVYALIGHAGYPCDLCRKYHSYESLIGMEHLELDEPNHVAKVYPQKPKAKARDMLRADERRQLLNLRPHRGERTRPYWLIAGSLIEKGYYDIMYRLTDKAKRYIATDSAKGARR